MPSPISEERSDVSSPKRQKIEETTFDDSDSDDSEEGTPEQVQQFYDEWDKSQGFEIDFSKLSFCSAWQPLDLDDSTMVDEPQTNRDFVAMLCNLALTKHNADNGTNLELGKILRANFHPSAGATFYMSFEVNDPSDESNQPKPYRAVVRYLPRDIDEVRSCFLTTTFLNFLQRFVNFFMDSLVPTRYRTSNNPDLFHSE